LVRERLKEVVDFATSESPYRNANKGWINDDVYLQWGSLTDKADSGNEELLDVSIFWEPVKKLVLILFLVIALASTLVFGSVSLSKGRFDFSLISSSFGDEAIKNQSQVDYTIVQTDVLEADLSEELLEDKIQLEQLQETSSDITDQPFARSSNQLEEIDNSIQPQPKTNLGSAGNLF